MYRTSGRRFLVLVFALKYKNQCCSFEDNKLRDEKKRKEHIERNLMAGNFRLVLPMASHRQTIETFRQPWRMSSRFVYLFIQLYQIDLTCRDEIIIPSIYLFQNNHDLLEWYVGIFQRKVPSPSKVGSRGMTLNVSPLFCVWIPSQKKKDVTR